MRLLTLMLLAGFGQASADETGERWRSFYEKIAQSYSIEMTGDESKTLSLSEYPALVWSNPARAGETNGAFWVWTNEGRPEAVGTIFSYLGGSNSRVVAHEFHSLSQAPLKAALNGEVVWTPAKGGIHWKEMSNAPSPKPTRQLRLLQMRTLARQFVVTAQNEVGRAEGEQQMRLMPQPLYRYETEDEGIDGALFTFVIGTDPECLLLLESDPKQKKWKMAVARFTHLSFRIEHNGSVLYQHRRGAEPENDADFRYVCFRNGTAPINPPPVRED